MIRVTPAKEPEDFDEKVRVPGNAALRELIGESPDRPRPGPKRKPVAQRVGDIPPKDLPPFWRQSLGELRSAYRGVCAYLGMKIHPATGAATVDHFKPKSKYQHLAYEWLNFRLATQQVNTYKGEAQVLDPFEIESGWFVLDIGTFEVKANPDLDDDLRSRIETTILHLRLNEDPTFIRAREEYHDLYHGLKTDRSGVPRAPLPFDWLESECPLVAYELERQGRLRK